jgi:lysophospholipase L1-like esterase
VLPLPWLSVVTVLGGVAIADGGVADIHFGEELRAFERADRDSFPAPGQVVFFGSSTIRLWDLERSFPGLDAINRGFGGSWMTAALDAMDRFLLPYRPRAIVLYEGDNDLANGATPDEVLEELREFLARVEDALPGTPVYVLSVKPSPARVALLPEQTELNRGFAALSDEEFPTVHYVDVTLALRDADGRFRTEMYQDDGLHLSPRGYEAWTAALLSAVGEEWSRLAGSRR